MIKLIHISIFILTLTLVSCSGQQVEFGSWKAFQSYLNNPQNGFVLKEEVKGFIYEVKITPPTTESKEELTINLRINRKNGTAVLNDNQFSQTEIMQIEHYFSFGITDDITLSSPGIKATPAFVHYERNYQLKPSIDIIIDFNGIKQGEDYSFKFTDRAFSQKTIEFKINQELLNVCYVKET